MKIYVTNVYKNSEFYYNGGALTLFFLFFFCKVFCWGSFFTRKSFQNVQFSMVWF